jgi:hypothetical protein
MSSAPATGSVEGFIPLNGSAGNSAPITGGKRRKLKLVTRKQARKMLKKLGHKMRGGADTEPAALVATKDEKTGMGGRRHRTKKHSRRHSRRSVFGLKY